VAGAAAVVLEQAADALLAERIADAEAGAVVVRGAGFAGFGVAGGAGVGGGGGRGVAAAGRERQERGEPEEAGVADERAVEFSPPPL
jgi:hypothetical protein